MDRAWPPHLPEATSPRLDQRGAKSPLQLPAVSSDGGSRSGGCDLAGLGDGEARALRGFMEAAARSRQSEDGGDWLMGGGRTSLALEKVEIWRRPPDWA